MTQIPVKVEFEDGPIPSLFIPNTFTVIVDNEGQEINKDGLWSTCSQTPCKQDTAEILTETQSVPKVESM